MRDVRCALSSKDRGLAYASCRTVQIPRLAALARDDNLDGGFMAQGGGGGLMVSVSGIRGRVGDALTPEVVARYASAFGAWCLAQGGSRAIVVGRDSRVSGPMFHRIVVGTLQLGGCDVIDIGLTTTPGAQMTVEHHHAAGAVMLSASHNP